MKRMTAGVASALLVTAIVAGCGKVAGSLWDANGNSGSQVKASVNRSLTLTVKPEFKVPEFKVQEVVNVYRDVDVTLLEIRLFKVDGETDTLVASADLTQSDLSSSVTFSGLAPNSRYHITSKAWVGSTVVSNEFSTYIDVADDSLLTPVTLTLQLVDKTFSGSASTNLDIQDGGLIPGASETITVVATPAPTPTPAPPTLTAAFSTSGMLSTVVMLGNVTGAVTGNYLLSLDRRLDTASGVDHYFLAWGTDAGNSQEDDLGANWPPAPHTITAAGAGSLTVDFMATPPGGAFPLNETVTIAAN